MGNNWALCDQTAPTISKRKDTGLLIFSNQTLYIIRLKFDK